MARIYVRFVLKHVYSLKRKNNKINTVFFLNDGSSDMNAIYVVSLWFALNVAIDTSREMQSHFIIVGISTKKNALNLS